MKFNIRLLPALLCVVLPINVSATGQTVSVLSDYRSDGVSQTKGKPAIQWAGEITFDNDSNDWEFYGRSFASNLQFEQEKGYEFDLGFGAILQQGNLKWDFGILNNLNLSLDNVDEHFLEAYVGLYVNEGTSIYFTYADDRETFDGGKNAKINLDQSFTLNENTSWSYQIGYTDMYRSRLSNSDYIWARIGLHYKWDNINISLDLHETDIKEAVDFNDIAQQTLTASMAVTF